MSFGEGSEGRLEITVHARGHDMERQPKHARSGFRSASLGRGVRCRLADQKAHRSGIGTEFVQQFELLCRELDAEERRPANIAAGPVEACYQTERDRISANRKNDR